MDALIGATVLVGALSLLTAWGALTVMLEEGPAVLAVIFVLLSIALGFLCHAMATEIEAASKQIQTCCPAEAPKP